jgi:hypothetical protein
VSQTCIASANCLGSGECQVTLADHKKRDDDNAKLKEENERKKAKREKEKKNGEPKDG